MGLLHIVCLALTVVAIASIDLKPYDRTALIFFNDFDSNHDAEITNDEVDTLYENVDTDSSGDLSREEFKVYLDAHYPSFLNYEDIVWTAFDFDGDSVITELDFEEVVEDHDQNNDTVITEAEFVKYWTVMLEGFELLIDLAEIETALNGTGQTVNITIDTGDE